MTVDFLVRIYPSLLRKERSVASGHLSACQLVLARIVQGRRRELSRVRASVIVDPVRGFQYPLPPHTVVTNRALYRGSCYRSTSNRTAGRCHLSGSCLAARQRHRPCCYAYRRQRSACALAYALSCSLLCPSVASWPRLARGLVSGAGCTSPSPLCPFSGAPPVTGAPR